MQSCFVYFSSWQEDTLSNHDRFVLQFRPKFYLLFTPTRLSINEISVGLSIMPSNVGSFKLKLYFYEEFLIMKRTTVSLRDCERNI